MVPWEKQPKAAFDRTIVRLAKGTMAFLFGFYRKTKYIGSLMND